MDFPAKWSWGWTTQRRIAKPSVASGKPLRPLVVVVNSLSSSPQKVAGWPAMCDYSWVLGIVGLPLLGHAGPSEEAKLMTKPVPSWLTACALRRPRQEMKAAKQTKSLAVSNFSPEQLDCILADPAPRWKGWAMGPPQQDLKILCSSGSSLIKKNAAGQSSCDFHNAGFCIEQLEWGAKDATKPVLNQLPYSPKKLGSGEKRSGRVMAKKGSNSKLDRAQAPKRCQQFSWTMNMAANWQYRWSNL